jgi:hypothetical protein
MVAIFVASSIPNLTDLPGGVSDTAGHGGGYALLSLLLVRALARARWRGVTLRVALGAVAISLLYGVTDEWHQRFVEGRTFELADLVADGAGALAAGIAARAWAIMSAASQTVTRTARPERARAVRPEGQPAADGGDAAAREQESRGERQTYRNEEPRRSGATPPTKHEVACPPAPTVRERTL